MQNIFTIVLLFCFGSSLAQPNQVSIDRIEQMPNVPSPYLMRNWKEVAVQYDAFVFNTELTGEYLPMLTLKPSGRNYPELQPIQLDTYVGTNSTTQAEAINIIPAIVSASLVGINKSNQGGINWVEKIKDFYNVVNGQNVYLNGSNSSSGNDWWYDVMPNIFFYQAYDLYPEIPGFENQFISVADQWLKSVVAMGGKTTPWSIPMMNYRGWYLSSMTGNSNGVKEPEAAGAIGWLLYQAYVKTNDKKYLDGAQMCLEYLSGLTSNPSYELQLPYGTLIAAKLNALTGSNHNVAKMLNWSFNKGGLRGWGTILGTWSGTDVSGLVGEANDLDNDYAFMMNGYQQAGALIPLVKYDKRFARAIAKWTLNLANASRLFYPSFLESDKQDDLTWSNEHDLASSIGYEALKENWEGKALYGTGDAKRSGWAETNLGLYGSSHAGYLAAIVETTNVDKVLQLDLNKTDFFADNFFPTYLYYNPLNENQQITVALGGGSFDLYDAISETKLAVNVTGNYSVLVKSDEVILLTYLPAGTITVLKDGKLFAGDHVIDHHFGYNFEPAFRIKSFSAETNLLEYSDETIIYATVENPPSSVSYHWFLNDLSLSETTLGELNWTATEQTGESEIKVEIHSAGIVLKDSILINVLPIVPELPAITSLTAGQKFYLSGEAAKIIAHVENADVEKFSYTWTVPSGSMEQQDSLLIWTTPAGDGLYTVSCVVRNVFELAAEKSIPVLVKLETMADTNPLAYYPLNTDVNDYSGNEWHAHVEGTEQAQDALGKAGFAHRFSTGSDLIFIDNQPALNFRDAITLSFWSSPGNAGHEAFILSHGSWEERWKVSITPDKELRWTVKTENGVRDLDSSQPVVQNEFVHVTVVYSGYSMEMYINGVLDQFIGHDGLLMTTGKAISFGQKSVGEPLYYYIGILDEVRIYDQVLQPNEILGLKTIWHDELTTFIPFDIQKQIKVFPNPSHDGVFWINHPGENIRQVQLIGPEGKIYPVQTIIEGGNTQVLTDIHKGLYLLKITTETKISFIKVILN
jgi:hypothetical protein